MNYSTCINKILRLTCCLVFAGTKKKTTPYSLTAAQGLYYEKTLNCYNISRHINQNSCIFLTGRKFEMYRPALKPK